MSTELFLNFLAIKMDGRKVAGHQYKINLSTADNGEKFLIELSNSTLTNVEGYLHNDPDLSMTINRTDLETVIAGDKDLEAQFADGTATFEGDIGILVVLAAAMVDFDPLFGVLPCTRDPQHTEPHSEAIQAVTGLPPIE
ncbi:alkyl sulfatase C-terminal domain-containing protein [Phaeobacter marinintestinus]|uniref:alkyl sulfatase C-terminal domain-containing protein n=1 Tax=Falsiphaeobacter marinintestinus TaxID=1492905 RepID=UPI001FE3636F|nr:alkyl sulfatase C-terminal domain-containing protein [Phaeobacter marinintestinus]